MATINVKGAIERFDGDAGIYLELLETYLAMPSPDFPKMKELLSGGERDELMRQIHKLKGGAMTLGADEFALQASQLETLLRGETSRLETDLLSVCETVWTDTEKALILVRDGLRKPS